MSTETRKKRIAFRPFLGDFSLEERVVLNGTLTSITAGAMEVAAFRNGGGTSNEQAPLENLTTRQIRQAFRQQFQASQSALREFVTSQARTLFTDPANRGPNGRLAADALANFSANIAGGINATALRLSAQTSLLPGSSHRLIPELQNALLGSQANALNTRSLSSRIANLAGTGLANRSQTAFQNAINREINQSFRNSSARFNSFFNPARLNRQSIDPTTGLQVPLSQFLINQAVTQTNNMFGTLANSVGPLARAGLFDTTGTFNPQSLAGFQQQFANALGTAAFQTGSLLSLFPNAATSLAPQLQSAFFGSGIDSVTGLPSTSFFNGFSGVFPTGTGGTTPFTSTAFDTGFQNAFTTSFSNFTTPLNNFFGIQPTGTGGISTLPNGFFQAGSTFPSVFGSQFTGSSFNNGFNNGFLSTGSGFPGFGTAPTEFNTGFGTGFNSFANTINQQFGFTQPSLGTGIGTGIGTGTPTVSIPTL